ncbi:MAG: FG-GAP-like repeat-containing protein [Saprospiraceae bacterium]|nr:FG-GAP-like repeat-containing protein [Saprospiraceae bacterium]
MYAGGSTQEIVAHRERGFMSAVSDVLHFGLGQSAQADSVEITYSDGKVQRLYQVAAGQTILTDPSEAQLVIRSDKEAVNTWFSSVTAITGFEYVHHDDPFSDFQYQPLLPHRLTGQGPVLATGDLNGDGLDDCFTGGGKEQPGVVFLQKPEGGFVSRPLEANTPGGKCTDACIFDANGDGLCDLYLVFGGNEWPGNDSVYQDRLYLNRGNGLLVRATQALPAMYNPKSCVTAADFDFDGDNDLFVGGFAEPYRYPSATRSYLLRNDGEKFTDVTDEWSTSLKKPGIVTDAVWADMNNDNRPDLVLAGEWMPVSVYQLEGKKFTQKSVPGTRGWWSTLEICDVNLDGSPDILAGNCGLNMRYQVSDEQPLILYSGDFDGNGSPDPIICTIENGETPIAQRQELMNQLSGIGSRYPRNASYAAATVQEIFGEDKVEKAWRGVCEITQSLCLLNEKGKFRAIPLPHPAQSAPVRDIVTGDFNADGFPDLVITGNSRAPVPAWGAQDALRGLILTGDGKGSFAPASVRLTGYYTDGIGSSLAQLRRPNGDKLLLTGLVNREISIFESKLK